MSLGRKGVAQPGALRSLLPSPPEAAVDRSLQARQRMASNVSDPQLRGAEPVTGTRAPDDKTRRGPTIVERSHQIVVLPQVDRGPTQYRLEDRFADLKQTDEPVFMNAQQRRLSGTRKAQVLAPSAKARLQAERPRRRVSATQRLLQSHMESGRRSTLGGPSTFQEGGAPARQERSNQPLVVEAGDRESSSSMAGMMAGNSWSRVHPKEYNVNDRQFKDMESTLISVETNMRLFREANRRRGREQVEDSPPRKQQQQPLHGLASSAAAGPGKTWPGLGRRAAAEEAASHDLVLDTRTARPAEAARQQQDSSSRQASRGVGSQHHERTGSESSAAISRVVVVLPVPLPDFPAPAEEGDSYSRWLAGQLHFDGQDLEAAVATALPKTVDSVVDEEMETTLLMLAASRGRRDLVLRLLERGADANRANTYGNTSLHFCVPQGHKDIAELLVGAGASSSVKNKLGLTCFERVNV